MLTLKVKGEGWTNKDTAYTYAWISVYAKVYKCLVSKTEKASHFTAIIKSG